MSETEGYVEKPVMMRTTAPHQDLGLCVFLIERGLGQESTAPLGSGFLIAIDRIQYAVTARHVVQEHDGKARAWKDLRSPLFIRAILEGTEEPRLLKQIGLDCLPYAQTFVFHPDESVDAAVFPTYHSPSHPERTKALPSSLLQHDDQVRLGEDVHLFGGRSPVWVPRALRLRQGDERGQERDNLLQAQQAPLPS